MESPSGVLRRLTAVGGTAGGASVEPAVLRLCPGAECTADMTIAPPRTADAIAGPSPFGKRVEPREQTQDADVVEGVRPSARSPRCVSSWCRAACGAVVALAVDNLGNQPLTGSFSTRDYGDVASVEANPTAVQVDPGRAGFAEVELTAVNVSWFGGARQRPFTVAVLRCGDAARQELRGTYLQPSVSPCWVLAVGSILLAVLVALFMIWCWHDTGVETHTGEQAPAADPAPPELRSPLPSPPPTPSTRPAPPPSAPAPRRLSRRAAALTVVAVRRSAQYDPAKPVRIQSGLCMHVTTAAGQCSSGDLYVYAAPESPDQPAWDQNWHVRPLPQDEFALTSSTEPKLVVDSK